MTRPTWILTATLTVLLTLLLVVPAHAADLRAQLRREIQPLVSQERFEEAITACLNAAEKTQDDALQAHCLIEASELALVRLKDVERALTLARQIRNKQRAASREMVILVSAKRYPEAIQFAGDVDLSQWPEDVRLDSFTARAEARLAQNKPREAAGDLEAATRCTGSPPRLAWACFQLGKINEEEFKDMDKALAAYERGTQVAQGAFAWRNRCFLRYQEIRLDRGQVEPVLKAFAEMDMAKLPSDFWRGEFLLLHAKALSRAGFNGQAATVLTTLIRMPEVLPAHKAAAEAQLAQQIKTMNSSPGK